MRKAIQLIIQVIVAIAFVAGSVVLAKKIAGSRPALPKNSQSGVATIFTRTVENGEVPIKVNATGSISALNRVDLFAEVQGVMQPDGGKFKEGNSYGKGETMLSITSADFKASLTAQRSNLLNLITAALADIKLDFPNSFEKWSGYAKNFDVNKNLQPLPEPASEQERSFITGRNILTTYYNIKNAEIVLDKYNISAPFSGVLTEALVTPGTVIRPGQKLGTFIDPNTYELETPVNASMSRYLKIGQQVELHATDNSSASWKGQIVRINSLVDPNTQTLNVYIRVSGQGLEEGMFLSASIAATKLDNAIELPREVLFGGNQVYVTDGSTLIQKTIEPLYFSEKTVVVRGLENGTQVLTKMPPSAHPGMEVTVSED